MEIPELHKNTIPKADNPFRPVFFDRLILPDLTRPGIVAVSGGADSVCLLRTLLGLGAKCIVAHLNHQLRGDESDADAAFVGELAKSLGCQHAEKRVDLKSATDNLENAARRERYRFFEEIAKETNAGWIATGHTADDQAETVLMRLLRGTGLQGLRGIALRYLLNDIGIVRPLLNVRRSELVTFLDEMNQSYRTDTSNADPKFTRNRIRHALMPILEQQSPTIVNLLGGLAEQAWEAHDYIEMQARKVLETALIPDAGGAVILKLSSLDHPPIILRQMFRHLWESKGYPLADMTQSNWERLAEMVWGETRQQHFPGAIRVRKTERTIVIE